MVILFPFLVLISLIHAIITGQWAWMLFLVFVIGISALQERFPDKEGDAKREAKRIYKLEQWREYKRKHPGPAGIRSNARAWRTSKWWPYYYDM
jgi:hypothetical protein